MAIFSVLNNQNPEKPLGSKEEVPQTTAPAGGGSIFSVLNLPKPKQAAEPAITPFNNSNPYKLSPNQQKNYPALPTPPKEPDKTFLQKTGEILDNIKVFAFGGYTKKEKEMLGASTITPKAKKEQTTLDIGGKKVVLPQYVNPADLDSEKQPKLSQAKPQIETPEWQAWQEQKQQEARNLQAKIDAAKIRPEEYFIKAITFGYAGDTGYNNKSQAVTFSQKGMELAGSIVAYSTLMRFLGPIAGGVISKIPGGAKTAKTVENLAQKYPWKVGYPLSIAKSGSVGLVGGALEKAETIQERATNALEGGATFAAFDIVAYPVVSFFRPTFYSLGKVEKIKIGENAKNILPSGTKVDTLFTEPKTIWFRHPEDPSLLLKVSQSKIPGKAVLDVVPAEQAGIKANTLPLMTKTEAEIFRAEPSTYQKLIDFISRKNPELPAEAIKVEATQGKSVFSILNENKGPIVEQKGVVPTGEQTNIQGFGAIDFKQGDFIPEGGKSTLNEIPSEIEALANEEWETNPEYSDKVGELQGQSDKLEVQLKTAKGEEKAVLQKQIDELQNEIGKIQDQFVEKWQTSLSENSKPEKPQFTPAEFSENKVIVKPGDYIVNRNGEIEQVTSGNDKWKPEDFNYDMNVGVFRAKGLGENQDHLQYANQSRLATPEEIKKATNYLAQQPASEFVSELQKLGYNKDDATKLEQMVAETEKTEAKKRKSGIPTRIENLNIKINKALNKFRKEADLMASNEGAGVRYYKGDAGQTEEKLYSYFKLSAAKSDMKARKEASQKYAHELMYENNPEYRKMVDERDRLLEKNIEKADNEIDVAKMFADADAEEKLLTQNIHEESNNGTIQNSVSEKLRKIASPKRTQEKGVAENQEVARSQEVELQNEVAKLDLSDEDKALLISKVTAEWKAGKANVVSSDNYKDLTKDYDPKNAARYSKLAVAEYNLLLKLNPEEIVNWATGGPGSGKSEIVVKKISKDFKGVILDTPMADAPSSEKHIQNTGKAGKVLFINIILQDPKIAWHHAQIREIVTGRGIPIADFANYYARISPTHLEMLKKFPDITPTLVDLRGIIPSLEVAKKVEVITDKKAIFDKISSFVYNKDVLLNELKDVRLTEKARRKALWIKESNRRAGENSRGSLQQGASGASGGRVGSSQEQLSGTGGQIEGNQNINKPLTKEDSGFNLPKNVEDLAYKPKNIEDLEGGAFVKENAKFIKRSEIAAELSKKLGVPIRRGKFRAMGAWGIFKSQAEIVRIKKGGLATVFHEVGHYLDQKFDISININAKERKALMQEYGHSYSGKPKRQAQEAFAEFLRFIMTGQTEKAMEWAPEFYDEWSSIIGSMPEIKKVIDTATEDFKRWKEMPATAKVLSQISIGEQKGLPIKERFSHGLHDLYTMALDDLHPLSEFSKVGEKNLGKISAEKDPYILARNLRGWVGKANTFLTKGTFGKDFWTEKDGKIISNFKGKSFQEIMLPIERAGNLDDFRVYLVAKRAIELAEREITTGIAKKDAETSVAELIKKHPKFEEKAQELYKYQDELLQYAADNGLTGEKGLERIKELNKMRVPFYRVMEEMEASGYMGKRKMGGNIGSPIKKIKGSEREIIDPIESIIKDTYAIINVAERNNIGVAMANLAKQDKDLGRLFEKVDKPMAPVKVNVKDVLNNISGINLAENPEMVLLIEELGEQMVTIFKPMQDRGPNMLNVNMGDEQFVFQVDPDLFKTIQGLNAEDVGLIFRILAMPSRILRAGATLSPDFSVRNPIRDQFSALVYSKYGFKPGIDLAKGIFELFKKGDVYDLWRMGGGEHSMLVSLDREALQKNYKDLMRTAGQNIIHHITHPIETLQMFSEITEQATRLGEMKRALQAGQNPISAAYASREVTLDFARVGTKTKAVNALIAFFNSNVQGQDKMIRAFKTRPFQTLIKALLGLTVPSILLYFANRKDPRWKEVPQWQKDLFWIVFTEKHIWRIPKPFELGILFGSVPERVLEFLDTRDPKLFSELESAIANGATPGFIPTFMAPVIENITNYSFFLNRPIVPQGTENLPPEAQTGTYTSETAKILGEALNYSPAKIDNLIYGYSGGLGRYVTQGLDKIITGTGIKKPPVAPESQLEDYPVIKAFMVRPPIGTSSESVNRIYDIYEKASGGLQYVNRLVNEGRVEEAKEYIKKNPDVVYGKMLNSLIAKFSEINQAREKVRQSGMMSAKAKQEKIKQLDELQLKAAQEALKMINGDAK